METSLLTTKLYIPPVRPGLVARPRLLDRLGDSLNCRLVLVSAPAGFGKTTLLSEWIHHSQPPAAWFSVEGSENDPIRFWDYFIAALKNIKPDVGETTLPILHSRQPFPIESVLTPLINDLMAIPENFFLVLDDYHFIQSPPVHDGVTFLLEHLPPRMHLVIATRADPPLPLARFRGKGVVLEIGADDLRFTLSEAVTLLAELGAPALSPENVKALNARAEGWVAGLKMAALSVLDEKDIPGFISSFTGSQRYIMDYLLEEVLQRQSPEVHDFLLKTSVLERLSGPLCDSVTGGNRGEEILLNLDKANLFVVPLDKSREWYRYHHLFAELLRHQLETLSGKDSVKELNQKASQWYEDNAYEDEAIEHALAAQDWEVAVRLLVSAGIRKERRGEWATFLRWMQVLPAEVLLDNPYLYCHYSKFLSATGQLDASEAILDKLEPISTQDTRLQGRMVAVRMHVAMLRGDMTRAVEYAKTALSLLPEDDLEERRFVSVSLGWIQTRRGLYAEAEPLLTWALENARQEGDHFGASMSAMSLCIILQCKGKLHDVVEMCQKTIDWVGQSPAAASQFAFLGNILYEWNDLEAALSHLEKANELSRHVGNLEIQEWIYDMMIFTRLAMGDDEGAEKTLQKINQLERDFDIVSSLQPVTLIARCLIAWWQGNLAKAMEWASKIPESRDARTLIISLATRIFSLRARGEKAKATALLKEIEQQTPADIAHLRIVVRLQQARCADTIEEGVTFLGEALTMAEPEGYIRTFVNQGMALAPLLRRAISRGIEPEYARKLLRIIKEEERQRKIRRGEIPAEPAAGLLSEREHEVLHLIAEGLTNQQIADKLFISLHTAKAHVRHILDKLDAQGRSQAITRARELKLL